MNVRALVSSLSRLKLSHVLALLENLIPLAVLLTALMTVEAAVVQRLAVPFIQAALDIATTPHSAGADRTAVLLFDGKHDIDRYWPLSYSRWEQVALSAWCGGARAVVFDIAFVSEGKVVSGEDTKRHFAHTLATIAGIPDGTTTRPAREGLAQQYCVKSRNEYDFRRQGFDPMPIAVGTINTGYDLPELQALAYSAEIPDESEYSRRDQNDLTTLAFFAANAWCKSRADPACDRIDDWVGTVAIEDHATTPAQQIFFSSPKRTDAPCAYRNGANSLPRLFAMGAAPTVLAKDWSVCPPVLTINNLAWDDPPTDISSAITDRILFVGGANLPSMRDVIDTQMHHELPGVILHALVANALITGQAHHAMPMLMTTGLVGFPFILFGLVLLALIAAIKPSRLTGETTLNGGVALAVGYTFFTFLWKFEAFPPLMCLPWGILCVMAVGGPNLDPLDRLLHLLKRLRQQAMGQVSIEISLIASEK